MCYTQHNPIQKHTATEDNCGKYMQIEKNIFISLTTRVTNTHISTKYRNARQLKTTVENACKIANRKKHLHQFDNIRVTNTHNSPKYRNARQLRTTEEKHANRKNLFISLRTHVLYSKHNPIQKCICNRI